MYGFLLSVLIILLTILFFLIKKRKTDITKPQTRWKDYSIENFIWDFSKIPPQKWADINSAILSLFPEYPTIDSELKELDPSQLILVDSEELFYKALENLTKQKIIGVDIEEHRKRSYLGFICLIQISTTEKIYLIDAIKLREHIPHLSVIFENPEILKIFHGSINDTQWLQRDFGICTVNIFDTYIAAKWLDEPNLGLNHLWKNYCNYHMSSKEKKEFQTSDWRKRPLTKEMLTYAALDVHYLIYLMSEMSQKLDEEKIKCLRDETNEISTLIYKIKQINKEDCLKKFKKHSIQALDTQSEYIFKELFEFRDKIAVKLDESCTYICPTQVLVEISVGKPKNSSELKESISSLGKDFPLIIKNSREILKIVNEGRKIPFKLIETNDAMTESIKRKLRKEERHKKFIEKYTVKKNVYENCEIQAPDGEILCFADFKKARWYTDKNLAEIVQKDPLIIRLKFEPNGRGFSDVEADQKYYSKVKKNACVVCGGVGCYLRYHVVPLIYRQAFPENYKSHRSHDVVLLCPKCHEVANKESDILKREIAEEFGIPLYEFGEKHKIIEKIKSIHRLCISLKKHRNIMPEDRKENLENQLMEFFETNPEYKSFIENELKQNIEDDIINVINYLADDKNSNNLKNVHGDVNWKKETQNMHGAKVVQKLTSLKEFIRRWRIHFVKTMNPQYLPEAWSVDHLLNCQKYPY